MPHLNGARERTVLYRLALLLEAVVFHRHVLFYPGYLFPWDFRAVHLPLATLIADSFRHGRFPLWDPYTYCGMPIAANIQAAVFYPPPVLAELAGAWLGDAALPRLLAISVVLQLVFAGWCTFALLRRLDAKPAAAFLGATVFELGCFFAAQAEHMGAVQAAVWLPAVWLCLFELRSVLRMRRLVALAASLAMTIFAGHPPAAVAVFLSAFVLALVLWLFKQTSWRLPAAISLAAVWALLLTAVQFIPTAEFTQNSVAKYRAEWLGSGGGIPPSALLSLLIPNYWSVFDLSKFHGPIDPTFLYLYSSLLGLLLAAAVAIWKPDRRGRIFLVMLAVFACLMFGDKTPPGRAIILALPDFIRIAIHPEYFFCVFSLALAVLAGLGAQRFLRSARLQLIAAILVAGDLIVVGSGRPMNIVSRAREPGFAADSIDGNRGLVDQLRALTAGNPPYRYDTGPDVSFLWSSSAPIIGIPTANGCDPMAPERAIALRLTFANGPRWGTCYQVVNPASPSVGLMNTRALVTVKPVDAPGYRLAAEIAGYRLYENQNVRPRYSLPGGAVQVVSYTPAAVRLQTDSPQPAELIAADSYYPGWRAFVDNQPAPLNSAEIAFRSIPVPAGRHTVDMLFVPETLFRSAALSALTLLITLAVFMRSR